jgi:hypothetical protein
MVGGWQHDTRHIFYDILVPPADPRIQVFKLNTSPFRFGRTQRALYTN